MVFSSFPDYTDNAYALYRYLNEEHKERYKCIWLYSDKESLKHHPQVKGYYKYSIQAFYCFARAKYVFCTHGIYDFLKMRRRDKIVNLWHGMPLKTIGCMDPTTGGTNPAKAHYLIATSPFFKEIMHKSFENVDIDNVLLTGQPRNDLMFHPTPFFENRGIDRTAYRSIGIWLPTYRRSIIGDIRQDGHFNDSGISFLSMDDLARLNTHLQATSSLLIVKLHPMDALQQMLHCTRVAPDNAEAFYRLGLILAEVQQYGYALSAFDKALQLAPTLHRARQNKIILLQHLGRTDEAQKETQLLRALQNPPSPSHP